MPPSLCASCTLCLACPSVTSFSFFSQDLSSHHFGPLICTDIYPSCTCNALWLFLAYVNIFTFLERETERTSDSPHIPNALQRTWHPCVDYMDTSRTEYFRTARSPTPDSQLDSRASESSEDQAGLQLAQQVQLASLCAVSIWE